MARENGAILGDLVYPALKHTGVNAASNCIEPHRSIKFSCPSYMKILLTDEARRAKYISRILNFYSIFIFTFYISYACVVCGDVLFCK